MAVVSYVIPNYNGKQLLASYLPSVIREAQMSNSEVIIIDDCSTDGSVAFIRDNYQQVRLFEFQRNQGYAAACNYGVAQSTSELVCILNTDVEILPGFLKPLIRHFAEPDIFVVSSRQTTRDDYLDRYYLPAVKFKFGIFWYKYQVLIGPLAKAVTFLFGQGAASVYDKNKFLALGGFDNLYRPFYWEDLDICYRAWKKGWKSIYEPESIHRHYGQATISRKHIRLLIMIFHWKNRFLFTWKNISSALFWAQHIFFLPFELFFLPFLGKVEFSLGFFYALIQLPEVVVKKLKDKGRKMLTDAQIITRFSPGNVKKTSIRGLIAIVYLHETIRISGAENSLINLVKNLDRGKFQPYFVLPEDGALAGQLKALDVPVELIPFPKIRKFKGVFKTFQKLSRFIRENNIQVIHSNSIRTHIYGALCAKYFGIKSIWHERNMLNGEIIDPDWLFSFLPDRIICNSLAIARRFSFLGCLPGKVKVVFNGVDIKMFNPDIDSSSLRWEFGINPDEIVVGISSRFNIQKGHEVFLKAARMIIFGEDKIKNKIRFLIVGGAVFDEDKKREKYLRDLVWDLGIKDKVIFTGYREDMSRVYAAMDIFVLASNAEPCGRVVLEAMACAKPIVATASGGTLEMIEDGASGVLFGANDYCDLAKKIIYLSNNPEAAQKMGEAARKRIEDNFKIEVNAAKIQLIYGELIL